MKTVYSKKHILRNPLTELSGGELVKPFECPERINYILKELSKYQLGQVVQPTYQNLEIIYKVHDRKYVKFLEGAWKEWIGEGFKGEAIPTVWPSRSMNTLFIPDNIEGKLGYYCLANETSISEGTVEAAYESVKVVLTASEILEKEKRAFALCRPPGHHASKDQYGGYCFFNNIAIATERLLEKGAKKIFILDIDFHHGNGTQQIFYERSDVFFASIHGHPKDAFPHFLGYENEKGFKEGLGFNLNYPLFPNTSYKEWLNAFIDVLKQIKNFNPDYLLISLGVDTFESDPISFFKLKTPNFYDIGQKLSSLNLPTLFVMEGGYAIDEIGVNTVNILKGFEE